MIEVAVETFSLSNSEPAFQLFILAAQQFEIVVGARMVTAAQDGDFDLKAQLPYFRHHLLEL